MTTVTSGSTQRTFHLPSLVTYVAMAPLVLWSTPNAGFVAHTDLCPPAQFVSMESTLPSLQPSEASTPRALIESIELQLGLSRAAVADLLGVTRPSLYAWIRGNHIRAQNAARLVSLKNAADLLTQAAGGALPALWQYQTLPDGESFAEGIRAGRNPVELARTLLDLWQLHDADKALLSSIFGD